MAISWLQGDDAAVRSHFTEVERVPKALEVTECVSSLIASALLSKGISGSRREQVQTAMLIWGQNSMTDGSWGRGPRNHREMISVGLALSVCSAELS